MRYCRSRSCAGHVCALGLLLFAGALSSVWPAVVAAQAPAVGASARVSDATGRLLATATFREAPDQVLISLTFPDPSALTGTHGIHIHEVGRCDPPDFASAGGIFDPFGRQHGLRNADGPMAGDVPSLVIGPNGLAAYNTSAPLVKLSPGPTSLLRPGGTSLVIFAEADDGTTQPEGNAGPRIACGIIVAADVGLNGSTSFSQSQTQRGQTVATNGDPDLLTALLIATLGALLLAAGVVLRQTPHSSDL
jgi:superoxide dismutase, Cu-Zn family